MFERVHSYVKRTLFSFVRIGKFREDKSCAILVGLNKDLAIMLNINFILLNKNNNCSQNEEMKAQILDKYKEACLYCHSSHYGKMSLLSQKNILVDAIFCILLHL